MANKARRRRNKRARNQAVDLVYYFAYGSNLLASRLRARVKYAKLMSIGQLKGYKLTFNFSTIGSGKCDIVETGNPEDVVWGAVFGIPRLLVRVLDQYEGVPYFIYERKAIKVIAQDKEYDAFTYVGVNAFRWHKRSAIPYDWYHYHVVLGAYQLGLPQEYQNFLQNQETKVDSNKDRREAEARFWL